MAASQATGCRGVGIDISPDCIEAALAMVAIEDAAARDGIASENASVNIERTLLKNKLAWVCADCVAEPDLLLRLTREHRATVIYLYVLRLQNNTFKNAKQ